MKRRSLPLRSHRGRVSSFSRVLACLRLLDLQSDVAGASREAGRCRPPLALERLEDRQAPGDVSGHLWLALGLPEAAVALEARTEAAISSPSGLFALTDNPATLPATAFIVPTTPPAGEHAGVTPSFLATAGQSDAPYTPPWTADLVNALAAFPAGLPHDQAGDVLAEAHALAFTASADAPAAAPAAGALPADAGGPVLVTPAASPAAGSALATQLPALVGTTLAPATSPGLSHSATVAPVQVTTLTSSAATPTTVLPTVLPAAQPSVTATSLTPPTTNSAAPTTLPADAYAAGLQVRIQPGQEAAVADLSALARLNAVSFQPTDISGLYELHGDPTVLAHLAANFAANPAVRYAEPIHIVSTQLTPNDPSFTNGTLYGLNGTWGIKAPAAWDHSTGSTAVTIADIDSGMDYNHPDLYLNVWLNQPEIPTLAPSPSNPTGHTRRANLTDVDGDGLITFYDLNNPVNQGVGKITDLNGDGRIDAADVLTNMTLDANGKDTGNGGWVYAGNTQDGDTNHPNDFVGWNFVANSNNPLDDNGHGTHTSGTIAAIGNNGVGVVGVNWTAQIMPLKFLNSSGSGTTTAAAAAIEYSITHGARLSSNSWGSGGTDPTLQGAISDANTAGDLFVAAAGNSATNNDTSPFYPASYNLPNVVAVAATDSNGNLAGFSNYGATSVDLGAPGVGITSTLPNNSYGSASGTSMATPHVAGTVGLVLARYPGITAPQVVSRLLSSVTPDAALAGKTVSGGIVNAGAAVTASWTGYAKDAQHTALSDVAAQNLQAVNWRGAVDLNPQYSGNDLLIHYGSPLLTPSNTLIVPVKTGASGGYELEAINPTNGTVKWTQPTDYILPPHNWIPTYQPALTLGNRVYFAGAGGTVYYLDNPDAKGAGTTGQLAFYGLSNYTANPGAFNGTVYINTPITADQAGNIYFGFQVTGSNPANLTSGIARISAAGVGTWVSARTASGGDANIVKVAMNAAPALSNDRSTLYVAVSSGNFAYGYLAALNSTTLSPVSAVRLKDPNGNDALVPDDGTASPMVGPNGDVFYGVLENPFPYNHDRGWMLHFSGNLTQTFTPGAFGWDDTPSVVPASIVPSYTGSSSYLLMTKYNDYAGQGGSGINKLAIVDPGASMRDPITGQTVMKEVLTIAGVTPDPEFPNNPGAVREWCINTAAVDPVTKSILANSEDGKLYRWDLTTNSFTQVVTLTPGIGEAYTPTVIGNDGTVYAINNGTLFAVRQGTSPAIDLNWSGGGITGPSAVGTFSPFTVNRTYTISGAAASGPFTITYYASKDAIFGNADDVLLGTETLSASSDLAVGTHTGTSPGLQFTTTGTYNLYAMVDGGNAIVEIDETNNVAQAPQQVVVTGAIILDNGQPGYSETGSWTDYSPGYGGGLRYAAAGNGSSTATWQTTGLAAGTYLVQATWNGYFNHATNAPFSIYDGNTLLTTALVNQQPAPNADATAGGFNFQTIATVTLSSGTLKVVLSNNANGYVIADALRIAPTAAPTIDLNWSGGGLSNVPATATTSAPITVTRTYTVSNSNPSNTVPSFTIGYYASPDGTLANGALIGSETVPAGQAAGTYSGTSPALQFTNAGSFYVLARLNDTGTVTESNTGNNLTQSAQPITVSGATILDNGQPGYSETGSWQDYSPGYGGGLRYTSAGNGSATATWQTTGLAAGTYLVQATWNGYFNHATNAPFSIYDGNTLLTTAQVNQQPNPNADATAGGFNFQTIATVTLSSGTLKVVLSNNANGYVIADALRIAPTTAPTIDLNWSGGGLSNVPATASTSTPFTVTRTYKITNSGSGTVPSFTIGYYASPDGTLTNASLLATETVPAGQAAGTYTGSSPALQFSVAGSYYLVARLNDSGTVPESNTGNNLTQSAQPIVVTGAVILDNGQPGYSDSGSWFDSSLGYGGSLRYAASGNGSSTATWQTSGLAAGTYKVQATWNGYYNHATNAPFSIYDGTSLLTTVLVNQQPAPNADATVNGTPFQTLATVTVNSGTLRIVLSNNANGYVVADALRILPS
jgi:subtilisin family serine protease